MRDLAALARLIGDPARTRMLVALMSGMALTATELAMEAGIAPSTASSHLSKLTKARLLAIDKQGRHRYFRLFDAEIAALLEQMMSVAAERIEPRRVGPRDRALRLARTCYDHLAGTRGVWLLDRLREHSIVSGRDDVGITSGGEVFLERFGINLELLAKSRRAICRVCLDWSERRHHLGGALGAAILDRIFALRWARRELGTRALTFSSSGERALSRWFERPAR